MNETYLSSETPFQIRRLLNTTVIAYNKLLKNFDYLGG